MPYKTDPREVYTLELQKLQRCFSDIQQAAHEVGDLPTVNWRQVEYIRQVNFMLLQTLQTCEALIRLSF